MTSFRTVNLIYVQYRGLLWLDYCPSYLETSQMHFLKAIPVATWSKECVWGLSLAWIAVLSTAWRMGCLSLVSVLFCQVEVYETGRSLIKRSPTAYVFVCHLVWWGATIQSTPTISMQISVRKKEWYVFSLHDSAVQTSTYKVTAVVHKQLPERWLDCVSTTWSPASPELRFKVSSAALLTTMPTSR
jgi:hypothetical protein